jgi:Family of unknown function (DUF6151)
MPTGRMRFAAGMDVLRCLSFSGKVLRWYADCCRTPIGNTAGPGFPVVGLIHSFMSANDRGRNELLGPPLCRIFEHSAIGPFPPGAPPPVSLWVVLFRGSRVLGWWARGLGRPNPFYDDRTKTPHAMPRLFAPEERAALGN